MSPGDLKSRSYDSESSTLSTELPQCWNNSGDFKTKFSTSVKQYDLQLSRRTGEWSEGWVGDWAVGTNPDSSASIDYWYRSLYCLETRPSDVFSMHERYTFSWYV